MKTMFDDPLLRIARLALTALLWLSLLIAAATLFVIPVLVAKEDAVTAELVSHGFESSATWWGAVLLALICAGAVLAFFFLRHLRSIVDSVADRDPFVPLNAKRLRNMAWLALAIQVVAIPMTRLALWFDAAPFAPNVHHNENGISLGWLLLALILFILARVFREGTRLREELEGTV